MSKSGHSVCPECGKRASGNFCHHCGAKLGGRFCNQCGMELPPGGKFCNQCGAKVGGGGAKAGGRPKSGGGGARAARERVDTTEHKAAAAAAFGGQNLAWWVAGAAMFVLIVAIGVPMVRPGEPAPPTTQQAPAGGSPAAGASSVDISQMTPIQRADALFNRIMRAVSAGDSLEAQQFMPMALSAYEMAEPLTNDGLFHVSLLQRTALQVEEALATAEQILADDPNHLLGLSAAAQAADELGDGEQAAQYYQHIIDAYDAEMADPLPEYLHHKLITDELKDVAEAYLAGR